MSIVKANPHFHFPCFCLLPMHSCQNVFFVGQPVAGEISGTPARLVFVGWFWECVAVMHGDFRWVGHSYGISVHFFQRLFVGWGKFVKSLAFLPEWFLLVGNL